MNENELALDNPVAEEAVKPAKKVIKKRDIFRFCAKEDMAVDLEKYHKIMRLGKRIVFYLPVAMPNAPEQPMNDWIEFEEEEAAKRAFEQIIGIWSADVLE